AIIIAHNGQGTDKFTEAIDVAVRQYQVGCVARRRNKPKCAARISCGQVCPYKTRIGEILAGKVAAGKKVVIEVDPAQVTGLVAGRGVKLRGRNSVSVVTTK